MDLGFSSHAFHSSARLVFLEHTVSRDRKSLTFALRFRAPDRTLTEDDASAARDAAVRHAAEALGAELRG